ncbi:MAG: glycosyltransferase family 2 protein [Lewinellaceae bacterium]|nr:glycosyltransferase family 2 protein [Lewinellaceae bacterium]
MNIVIPMAGYGKRFSVQGYKLPKPIIDVKGKPMVWWALESIPKVEPDNLIFIVNQNHVLEFNIDEILKKTFSPQIEIIIQKVPPMGQATTVLLAKEKINTDEPLIIYNCDTYAPTAPIELSRAIGNHTECDGFIPVFKSNASNLSYVRTENSDIVVEVAEKKVISNDATMGLYYFKKGKDFVWAAEKMIEYGITVNGEYYVMPAYQYLIDAGQVIRKLQLTEIHVLGTPNELKEFLKI